MSEQTEFEFYSPKVLCKRLDINPNWLNHNRTSPNPIPFHRLGNLVRYQQNEVLDWIEKNRL